MYRHKKKRRQRIAVPQEVWMAGDGMVYAQRPVLAHPPLIKALFAGAFLACVWAGLGYVAWLAFTLLPPHVRA